MYVDTTVFQIDVDLVKPTMRAAVEEQLNLIAHGKADFNAVLGHTINTFTAKFKYFVEHVQAMDELFEVSFSPLASSGRPISRYFQLQVLMSNFSKIWISNVTIRSKSRYRILSELHDEW